MSDIAVVFGIYSVSGPDAPTISTRRLQQRSDGKNLCPVILKAGLKNTNEIRDQTVSELAFAVPLRQWGIAAWT